MIRAGLSAVKKPASEEGEMKGIVMAMLWATALLTPLFAATFASGDKTFRVWASSSDSLTSPLDTSAYVMGGSGSLLRLRLLSSSLQPACPAFLH